MADSTSTIYKRILWSWRNWHNPTIKRKYGRKCKRKFSRVSREEIEAGLDDGAVDGYGKYDEGDLGGDYMFFDERVDFYGNYY